MKCSSVLAVLLVFSVLSCSALEITNGPAVSITRTSAWITAGIVALDTPYSTYTNTVRVCYGLSDGITNAWTYTNTWGVAVATGIISNNIGSLSPSTHYYYRWNIASATNGSASTNVTWSTNTSVFWTIAGVPTGTPATATHYPVMVDTNGNLVSPTNFFSTNATDTLQSVFDRGSIIHCTYDKGVNLYSQPDNVSPSLMLKWIWDASTSNYFNMYMNVDTLTGYIKNKNVFTVTSNGAFSATSFSGDGSTLTNISSLRDGFNGNSGVFTNSVRLVGGLSNGLLLVSGDWIPAKPHSAIVLNNNLSYLGKYATPYLSWDGGSDSLNLCVPFNGGGQAITNISIISGSSLVLTNLPTDTNGLPVGAVYRAGSNLFIFGY